MYKKTACAKEIKPTTVFCSALKDSGQFVRSADQKLNVKFFFREELK